MTTIKVRASRIWTGMNFANREIINKNVIFIDAMGDQILLILRRHQKDKYPELREEQVYTIKNFKVVPGPKRYKPISGYLALAFYDETKLIEEQDTITIPRHQFELSSFDQARSRVGDTTKLIDVVGKLFITTQMQTLLSGRKKMDIVITNERDEEMNATLWEEHATDFEKKLDGYQNQAITLIITSNLAKLFGDEEDEGIDSYRKGGYHAVRVGDTFASGRYIAQRKLGWGQFSTVWLAYDTQTSKFVALKIQKSAPEFAQSALHEIEVLSAIADRDPSSSKHVIRLIDHFKHIGPNGQHLCMVLEFLGDSMLQLIRYNRYKGIELNKVREICKCILTGLDYLHRELGIIHTDLKPENILLCSTINPAKDPIRSGMTPILEKPEGNPNGGITMSTIEKKLKQRARRAVAKISGRRSSMGGLVPPPKPDRCLDEIDMRCKVVDFGNACWENKRLAEEIQTRQYRAPEVILQSGYSFPADMWSFACTAFELATGEMMFAPKATQSFSEDEDHLARMMELLGKMPRKIAVGGLRSKDYFDRHGDLKRIRRLKYGSLDRFLVDRFKFSETDAREFADFLCPIINFAPEKRLTAEQCLQHPWLNLTNLTRNEVKSESSVGKVNVAMNNLQIKVGK